MFLGNEFIYCYCRPLEGVCCGMLKLLVVLLIYYYAGFSFGMKFALCFSLLFSSLIRCWNSSTLICPPKFSII